MENKEVKKVPLKLKIVSNPNPVVLNVEKSKPIKPVKKVIESDDESSDSDSSEESEVFYVEIGLGCKDEDEEYVQNSVIFNFINESNYTEHLENDDLDEIFEDAVGANYPNCSFTNEWEEIAIHGEDLPEDYDGDVVDVPE